MEDNLQVLQTGSVLPFLFQDLHYSNSKPNYFAVGMCIAASAGATIKAYINAIVNHILIFGIMKIYLTNGELIFIASAEPTIIAYTNAVNNSALIFVLT